MPEIKEKYDKLKYNKKWDAENCKKVTIKMRKADYEIFNKYVTDWGKIKNEVKDALGDFVWKETKRRPMIMPIIMEV